MVSLVKNTKGGILRHQKLLKHEVLEVRIDKYETKTKEIRCLELLRFTQDEIIYA